MGLWSILRKLRQKERTMRLLVLGLDNAGKTTIVKRLKGDDVHSVSPTLGFNIDTLAWHLESDGNHDVHEKKNVQSDSQHESPVVVAQTYQLHFWDVGGQTSLRSYWRNYFEQTEGVIWVVDSADRRRISDTRDELHRLLLDERLAGASLLILANKQDLSGALTVNEMIDGLDLCHIHSHHWHIVPCSAIVGQVGLEHLSVVPTSSKSPKDRLDDAFIQAMNWIVRDIASRMYMYLMDDNDST